MKEFFQSIAEHPIYLLWAYLALINLLLFILMGVDKLLAVRQKRRIPEATLFLLAFIGGSVGGLLGMILFRHKTKHASFWIGFILFLALHLALAIWLLTRSRAA